MTLTEEYLKTNLITAYFIDNERKNIEVLTTSEDKKTNLSTVIPYDVNYIGFQSLTKFLSIEQELDKMRRNQTENPYLINEAKQPVRVKSTGQGADALLQTNRDFPAYTDNFTKTTTWNSN
jgi:hypothetical protein